MAFVECKRCGRSLSPEQVDKPCLNCDSLEREVDPNRFNRFQAPDHYRRHQFLKNFRRARNFFVHPRLIANGTPPDPHEMGRAALWLEPKSVRFFSELDFPELGTETQQTMLTAVRAFLQVAYPVRQQALPTPEQLSAGTAAIQTLLGILEPYLVDSPEEAKVEKALRKVAFPPWTVNWDFALDEDEYGTPGVSVHLFVDTERTPVNDIVPFRSETGGKIRESLEDEGCERWPFLVLHSTAEHKKHARID